jgi:hypothetical protein
MARRVAFDTNKPNRQPGRRGTAMEAGTPPKHEERKQKRSKGEKAFCRR